MEKTKVRVKKWGNSFGVVLPKALIEKQKLKEGVEIEIIVEPRNVTTVGDLMKLGKKLGLNKKLKNIDTQQALDEVDKDFWPEDE
ncbi:MAG: AbrB/MazE/SpoVT family DNA-binding domain-containing protein [Nanoarchaeota archaeon]